MLTNSSDLPGSAESRSETARADADPLGSPRSSEGTGELAGCPAAPGAGQTPMASREQIAGLGSSLEKPETSADESEGGRRGAEPKPEMD
jgi:hypothetical protein